MQIYGFLSISLQIYKILIWQHYCGAQPLSLYLYTRAVQTRGDLGSIKITKTFKFGHVKKNLLKIQQTASFQTMSHSLYSPELYTLDLYHVKERCGENICD